MRVFPTGLNDDDELFLWCWPTEGVMVGRRKALFPAGSIVRDPHHRESPTRREQGLNLLRTEFRLSWMKLCSSDNHYTTAPLITRLRLNKSSNTILQIVLTPCVLAALSLVQCLTSFCTAITFQLLKQSSSMNYV